MDYRYCRLGITGEGVGAATSCVRNVCGKWRITPYIITAGVYWLQIKHCKKDEIHNNEAFTCHVYSNLTFLGGLSVKFMASVCLWTRHLLLIEILPYLDDLVKMPYLAGLRNIQQNRGARHTYM